MCGIDHPSSGIALLRQLADAYSAIKAKLRSRIHGCGQVSLEAFIPHSKRALGSILNARFRKTSWSAGHWSREVYRVERLLVIEAGPRPKALRSGSCCADAM